MSLVSFSSHKRDIFEKSIAIDWACKKKYQKYHGDSEYCGARILWVVLYKLSMANEVLKRDVTERKDVT